MIYSSPRVSQEPPGASPVAPPDHPHSKTIASEKIIAESKTFYLDLQENHRGRFFKLAEDNKGRRSTVIVATEVVPIFMEAVKRLLAESDARP